MCKVFASVNATLYFSHILLKPRPEGRTDLANYLTFQLGTQDLQKVCDTSENQS